VLIENSNISELVKAVVFRQTLETQFHDFGAFDVVQFDYVKHALIKLAFGACSELLSWVEDQVV
jgi:hypothetical protein